jgi:hypothetical protein
MSDSSPAKTQGAWPASDQSYGRRACRDVLGVALSLILVTLWNLDFPHQQVSTLIGRYFPWPTTRPLKWSALLLERTLIEAIVCLPATFLLATYVRWFSVYVALVLAGIFCLKVGAPLNASATRSYQWAVIHVTLLVGGTAVQRSRDGSMGGVGPAAQGTETEVGKRIHEEQQQGPLLGPTPLSRPAPSMLWWAFGELPAPHECQTAVRGSTFRLD